LLFFPERRFCHCDNPSPVQHDVCEDEKSHDHAGNVMGFRKRGRRNKQKNIPEIPRQLRDLDDTGNKCQKKCDDQPAIDEIIQPALICHLYPALEPMGSNKLSIHVCGD